METMTLDGIEFYFDAREGKDRAESHGNRFTIVKNERMLAHYEKMKSRPPRTIMEVGVFQGGSMVYIEKLFSPEKIIGVDAKREPIPALDAYIEHHPNMKMYYARYQEQPGTLMAARENFPTGIDLVIDDASHLYEQTKATFKMLFPLVRHGGEYLIEDWAWSHRSNRQTREATWSDKPAMTNLIFELVVLSTMPAVIESLEVTTDYVSVRRGHGALPKDLFDLSPYLRGKPLQHI